MVLGGCGRATVKLGATNPTAVKPNTSCLGVKFPTLRPSDTCATWKVPVAAAGLRVMASNLRPDTTDSLGGPRLCVDVTYVNAWSGLKSFEPTDWGLEVETPSGVVNQIGILPYEVKSFGGTGTLGGGQLAAGGHTSGSLCFGQNNGEALPHGEFLLTFDTEPMSHTGRVVWIARR